MAQINAYEPIASEDRTVYFNFNKTTLAPSEQRKLNALVSVMKPMENIRSVTVVGYADRIGKTDYNERLSQKRAQVVENYLHQYGYLNAVDAKTEWLGEAESITACSDKLARNPLILCLQKDRRVTVDIQYNN